MEMIQSAGALASAYDKTLITGISANEVMLALGPYVEKYVKFQLSSDEVSEDAVTIVQGDGSDINEMMSTYNHLWYVISPEGARDHRSDCLKFKLALGFREGKLVSIRRKCVEA